MSVLIDTIARPYAKAIFEMAKSSDQQLAQWLAWLNQAAQWIVMPDVARLLDDPKVMPSVLLSLFKTLFAESLDQSGEQFLSLLIEYKRLAALPQIAALFSDLVAAYSGRIEVSVKTAFDLTQAQHKQLLQALSQRLQRDVEIHYTRDHTLIGGIIVRIGDTVIDGSLRGRLNRLRSDLEEN
jgi:F-type H+-transporting ATPase subunit delta